MTPEQRKRAAEIVTGKEHAVKPWRPVNPEHNKDYIVLAEPASGGGTIYWSPKFHGQDYQRSQALAVVEWIANKITDPKNDGAFHVSHDTSLVSMIAARNIDELLEVVLEICDG